MSKESKIKKRLEYAAKQQQTLPPVQKPAGRKLTDEEKARIIRDRLANRPVLMLRYPNGKLNKKFIITAAIMLAALIAALFFISRI
jgi:hypothetical protein